MLSKRGFSPRIYYIINTLWASQRSFKRSVQHIVKKNVLLKIKQDLGILWNAQVHWFLQCDHKYGAMIQYQEYSFAHTRETSHDSLSNTDALSDHCAHLCHYWLGIVPSGFELYKMKSLNMCFFCVSHFLHWTFVWTVATSLCFNRNLLICMALQQQLSAGVP